MTSSVLFAADAATRHPFPGGVFVLSIVVFRPLGILDLTARSSCSGAGRLVSLAALQRKNQCPAKGLSGPASGKRVLVVDDKQGKPTAFA
jgi:hypothetical protein